MKTTETTAIKSFIFKQILTFNFLFLVLMIIHLVPIWLFEFFPSQDGPSHIYNASLLLDYSNANNQTIREAFQTNINPFPNWIGHLILMLLMPLVGPLAAEKILISLCVLLLPLAMAYLLSGLKKNTILFSLLGFILAYNNLLHMGFYSFMLGTSFALFSLGYWWRHWQTFKFSQLATMYGLLTITYFCHFVPFAFTLISIFVFVSTLTLAKIIRGKIVERSCKTIELISKHIFVAAKSLWLIPAYFVAQGYYLLANYDTAEVFYPPFMDLIVYLIDFRLLVSYTNWHLYVSWSLQATLLLVIIINTYLRIRHKIRFISRDVFLILFLLFLAWYLMAPWATSGGGWFNPRLCLFAFIFLAAWFTDLPRHISTAVLILLVTLSIFHAGRHTYEYYHLQPDLKEMTAAIDHIEPHSILAPRVIDDKSSTFFGELVGVNPFRHPPAYYALGKDVVLLDNYEAAHSYFPINWKKKYADPKKRFEIKADYILAWGKEMSAWAEKWYKNQYTTIFSKNRLLIMKLHRKHH
jgi:hypothetical protein